MQAIKNNKIWNSKLNNLKKFCFSELPRINYTPKPYNGRSAQELRKLREKHLNPGIFHVYNEPYLLTDGYMQYVFNEKGEQFLDLFGGICTFCRHCHPVVTEKIKKQLDKLQHISTLYLTEPSALLAEKIASKLPKGLDNFYFVNSGSEANELAITLAKLHTGNHDVYALQNGYHGAGNTSSNLTALRTWKYNIPKHITIKHTCAPTLLRNPYGDATIEKITEHAVRDLSNQINYGSSGDVAIFYSEPAYQGVGGITPTRGDGTFHKQAYQIVRQNGGLCLADEVQSGWGRLGNRYWGFEGQGVVPDFVSVAKSIGNGIPIAAIITRREIAQNLKQKLHFNTYGGNPVSCAAALATIEAIEEDGLQQNCEVVGTYFIEKLKGLMKKFETIGEVRGEGLMIGMELVTDKQTLTPAPPKYTSDFLQECLSLSLLVGKGGLNGNVIRIQPPMCLNKQDVDYAIYAFEKVLNKIRI